MDVGGVRERLARRAAKEVEEGMVVNLGIGIPTLIADFLPPGGSVHLQAKNAVFGSSGSPARGQGAGILSTAGGFRFPGQGGGGRQSRQRRRLSDYGSSGCLLFRQCRGFWDDTAWPP